MTKSWSFCQISALLKFFAPAQYSYTALVAKNFRALNSAKNPQDFIFIKIILTG